MHSRSIRRNSSHRSPASWTRKLCSFDFARRRPRELRSFSMAQDPKDPRKEKKSVLLSYTRESFPRWYSAHVQPTSRVAILSWNRSRIRELRRVVSSNIFFFFFFEIFTEKFFLLTRANVFVPQAERERREDLNLSPRRVLLSRPFRTMNSQSTNDGVRCRAKMRPGRTLNYDVISQANSGHVLHK